MAVTIRDRLEALQHAAFVGRDDERAAFRALLTATEPREQVVYVHGPGGVGKTALLREFRYLCADAGRTAALVDGRNVDPTPGGFLGALARELELPADAMQAHLAGRAEPLVLMVDTYERVRSLDDWIRAELLPGLSERCLLVLADREPPRVAWRTHAGLRALVRFLPLRNLPPADSRSLLRQRGVPAEQIEPVQRFTHGHPLALALVGDVCAQRPGAAFSVQATIDVIPSLLERLASEAARSEQREALEAASIVRSLTEPLLAAMLDTDRARDLFAWLRSLTCMEVDPHGLRPHDLVRDVLAVDLRWRDPRRFAAYHERARRHLHEQFFAASETAQQRFLFDLLFLHRENPMVAPFFDWGLTGAIAIDALTDQDIPALVAAVRRHEGDVSARIAAHWFAAPSAQTLVVRERDDPLGFVTMVSLGEVTSADEDVDPVTTAVLDHLDRHAPLRPGEVATLFRTWMALDTHQEVSPVQGVVFLQAARHYLTTSNLAYTYFCCADGDFWDPSLAYWDVPRIPGDEFSGAPGVAVYGHDWRARPPLAWLDLLADRETSRDVRPPSAAPPPLLVLSEPDFAAAVHDALRGLYRYDGLADNPLLRSRLVDDATGPDATPGQRREALGTLVTAAAEELRGDPRTARGYRAVHRTWLDPADSQERAAEALDLPFSTYRRHLREGLEHVTASLWRRELGEAPSVAPTTAPSATGDRQS